MGQALRAVLDAMGEWGAHWLEIEPRHMDPAYVLWATMKLIDVDKIPAQTTVVRFALRDRPTAGYWLILRRPRNCARVPVGTPRTSCAGPTRQR